VKVKFKIFRFNPETDEQSHYDVFTVKANVKDRILDCLNKIRWEQDSSLAYRMSCAHGICGSDGLTINGSPALACQKLVKDYDYAKEIVVEPLKFFTVVKDLIVNMEQFFERIKAISPVRIERSSTGVINKEHTQTPEERRLFDDAIKCILCACCIAACPVTLKEEPDFIGPAAILRAHRYIFDSRVTDSEERMKVLEKPHGIWSCKSYYRCTQVCPKNIKVTEAILKTKKKILQQLHPKKKRRLTDENTNRN
jgi:succinate dehydrogenase / fumarate reductase iron-sulfur subunit